MKFRFRDSGLEGLYYGRPNARRMSEGVTKGFFNTIAIIAGATSENDLRAFKSRNYERLKGNRQHQSSLRLNGNFRLIVELEEDVQGNIVVIIVDLEDYH